MGSVTHIFFYMNTIKSVPMNRMNTEVHVGAVVESEVYVGAVEVEQKCKSVQL